MEEDDNNPISIKLPDHVQAQWDGDAESDDYEPQTKVARLQSSSSEDEPEQDSQPEQNYEAQYVPEEPEFSEPQTFHQEPTQYTPEPEQDSQQFHEPQQSSQPFYEAQEQDQSAQSFYAGGRASPVSQKPGMLQQNAPASPRNLQHRQNLVSSTNSAPRKSRITRQLTQGPPPASPQKRESEEDPFANKAIFGEDKPQIFNATTTTGPFSIDSAIVDTGDLFHDLLFKIVIVGNSGVGKTGLLGRWLTNRFESTSATISVEFKIKTFKIDGKIIKVQMWDTAGQEQFKALTQSFYRNANGAILVYDVTNVETFRNLETWLRPIQEAQGNEHVQIMLVGNKIDLDYKRKITTKQGLDWAQQEGLSFLETSALDGSNVHRAFQMLLQDIYSHTNKQLQSKLEGQGISLGKGVQISNKEEKSCC